MAQEMSSLIIKSVTEAGEKLEYTRKTFDKSYSTRKEELGKAEEMLGFKKKSTWTSICIH